MYVQMSTKASAEFNAKIKVYLIFCVKTGKATLKNEPWPLPQNIQNK